MRARVATRFLLIGCLGLGAAGGCETIQENPEASGAVIGGLAGAGVGAAVGGKEHRTEGALIGGAAGAGGGYLVGDQVDKRNDSKRSRRVRSTSRDRYYDDDVSYRSSARPARYRDSSYDRYDSYDRPSRSSRYYDYD